jgi:CubicO group peptidase (beta-lactamase class C family)
MRAFLVGSALALIIVPCGAHADSGCLGKGQLEAALRMHMAAEATKGFTGAIAIDQGGKTFTWASKGFEPDKTRFWIASITKSLTATAAERMAERGDIRLDTRVGEVFPSTTGMLRDRSLAQLLAHRAGLKHLYAADGITDRLQAVGAINSNGVQTEGFFYSNDGYSLAAAMLEQMTGNPFEDILRSEVFAPAGMGSSGVWGQAVEAKTFAPFPTSKTSKMVRNGIPVRNYGQLGPSGVYSTAADMLAFLIALRKGRLLSDNGRSLLWTPGWRAPPDGKPRSGTSYGLGWGLTVENGRVLAAWHGGNEDWLRHNGQIKSYLERPLDIVILSNGGDKGDDSWSKRELNGIENCFRVDEAIAKDTTTRARRSAK